MLYYEEVDFAKNNRIFVQINSFAKVAEQPTEEKFKITFFKSFLHVSNLRTDMYWIYCHFFFAVRYFRVTPGFRRANKSRCQSLLIVAEEPTGSFRKSTNK